MKKITKAERILHFIGSKGNEGASFKDIQRFILVDMLKKMSHTQFEEKEPQRIWHNDGSITETMVRKTRGFYCSSLYGTISMRGLLPTFCEKNGRKWVLSRMPNEGEAIHRHNEESFDKFFKLNN